MTDVEVLEIPFTEAFPRGSSGSVFDYDDVKFPHLDAEERALARVEVAQKIRDEIVKRRGSLYVKLTAGQRAGTIGLIQLSQKNVGIASNHDQDDTFSIDRLDKRPPVLTKDQPKDGWRRSRGEGAWHVYNEVFARSNWYSCENFIFTLAVDGRGNVQDFYYDSPFTSTAKPVILLGYDGPTVWSFTQKNTTKAEFTIKDRYGREVKKGDVVIASMRPSGTQMVGKVVNITAKRSIKLKHIGAKEETTLVAIRDDQVILLDDELQRVLMFKKLQTL